MPLFHNSSTSFQASFLGVSDPKPRRGKVLFPRTPSQELISLFSNSEGSGHHPLLPAPIATQVESAEPSNCSKESPKL